ncbi:hypothetical protein EKN38_09020 [Enterobacter sp. WCHEn045836]|nr:hypothetical protein EKN38_09020 [Enterobacter sp. WCHEn045836]
MMMKKDDDMNTLHAFPWQQVVSAQGYTAESKDRVATDHDQPAGFRLNADQRVHQYFCGAGFKFGFAGVKQ